jgi:ribosome biogenesis protein
MEDRGPILMMFSRHFLTAGYDGVLRAFDFSQNPVTSSTIHSGPITSLHVVTESSQEGSHLVLTGSHDLTAKLCRFSSSQEVNASNSVSELASFHLHTAPISSVAASRSAQTFLTASWDGLIGVWDSSIPANDEVPAPEDGTERRKRRKVAREENAAKRKAPTGVLKSHTARVSKVVFGPSPNTQNVAYSCGHDSTVRVWDVENGLCTHTIVSHVFL